MIGLSRFEGGSWVRAGFLLTYTAFAYGCVVVGTAVTRLGRPTGLMTGRAGRIAVLAAPELVPISAVEPIAPTFRVRRWSISNPESVVLFASSPPSYKLRREGTIIYSTDFSSRTLAMSIGPAGDFEISGARYCGDLRKLFAERTCRIDAHDRPQAHIRG